MIINIFFVFQIRGAVNRMSSDVITRNVSESHGNAMLMMIAVMAPTKGDARNPYQVMILLINYYFESNVIINLLGKAYTLQFIGFWRKL
jgi:hypothetical protein